MRVAGRGRQVSEIALRDVKVDFHFIIFLISIIYMFITVIINYEVAFKIKFTLIKRI